MRTIYLIHVMLMFMSCSSASNSKQIKLIDEYVAFLNDNISSLKLIQYEGEHTNELNERSGYFYELYYYQETGKTKELVIKIFADNKNDIRIKKNYYLKDNQLCYFSEEKSGGEASDLNFSLKCYMKSGKILYYTCENCKEDFDIKSYMEMKIKETKN